MTYMLTNAMTESNSLQMLSDARLETISDLVSEHLNEEGAPSKVLYFAIRSSVLSLIHT